MSKYKIQSITFKHGQHSYNVKKVPAGNAISSDPVDVTCLDDTLEQFLPGALKKQGEFTALVNGITEAPEVNEVADVTITVKYNDGTTDTERTVTIPGCILKAANPPDPEAGGDRAANWELVFQPNGSAASGSAA